MLMNKKLISFHCIQLQMVSKLSLISFSRECEAEPGPRSAPPCPGPGSPAAPKVKCTKLLVWGRQKNRETSVPLSLKSLLEPSARLSPSGPCWEQEYALNRHANDEMKIIASCRFYFTYAI